MLAAVDDLLSSATAQRNSKLVLEVVHAVHATGESLLAGEVEGGAARAACAGDDGDLLHGVVARQEGADEGVARLVVGSESLDAVRLEPVGLLRAQHNAVQGCIDVLGVDLLLALPGGEDGCLVHEVLKRGSAEAGGPPGDGVEVHIADGLALDVHIQNGTASRQVREVDGDASVEATRSEKGLIQDVGTIGGGNHDYTLVAGESVHFGEQLVECLLSLVVLRHEASRGPCAADGVDLIDEDDAGRNLLGLLEQITHAAGTDTDEHLNEVGSRL
mmetsp:Transcript_31725/g.78613  ORF Transcript_31725/g.78613 Transcript_31725/m.78613 type:complete len:274 (+) Transcript_31725:1235-2056(+)